MSSSLLVNGTLISEEAVRGALRCAFPSARLASLSSERIGEDQGSVCHVLRLRLRWEVGGEEAKGSLPESLVLKTPAIGKLDGLLGKDGGEAFGGMPSYRQFPLATTSPWQPIKYLHLKNPVLGTLLHSHRSEAVQCHIPQPNQSTMSSSLLVNGTLISEEAVRGALRCAFPSARLASLSSERIGEDQGSVCHVLRLRLRWEVGGEEAKGSLPESLVLKTPAIGKLDGLLGKDGGEAFGGMAALIAGLHNRECDVLAFFTERPPPFPHAKVYGVRKASPSQAGYVLMEDLSGDMSLASRSQGLSRAQLEMVVEALADLTAYSLTIRGAWEGSVGALPADVAAGAAALSAATLPGLRQLSPELFSEEDVDALVATTRTQASAASANRAEELWGGPLGLVHGDLHAGNIVFSEDGGRLRALIDWQGCRPGTLGEDVWRLLTLSVAPELRRESFEALLGLCLQRLGSACPDLTLCSLAKLESAVAEARVALVFRSSSR